jgi:maltose-binding protein MalE
MKSTMKFVTVLALIALLGSTLVLNGSPMAVSAQGPTDTPAPTNTFVPSEEGTLTLWVDKERTTMAETLGKDFTAKYTIPVRVQQMGFGDIRNNFNLAAPVGEAADIIIGAHDWIGQLVGNGLLAEIDLGDKAASFDPVGLKAFTYQGKLVGLPYRTEAVAIYYNTDVMEAVPATWAETVALAKQLVADKKVERGIAVPTDSYHNYFFFSGSGGYVFGRDAEGNYNPSDVGLDTAGGIKGARALEQLVKDGVFDAAVGYDQGRDLFQSGKLAMWVTGPWALGDIRKSGVKYAVAPIPPLDETARPFVGVQGFMVNKFSKNEELAKAFLVEYVATDEGMKLLYDAVPSPSAWLPLNNSLTDADMVAFGKAAANGDPMPAIPAMNAVWNAWGNAVTLIYQGKEDAEKAITEAATAIRAEIAKTP